MLSSNKDYRSPLGRARGLGASHGGVHHWWIQRLTAIGLVPLGFWLLYALIKVSFYDYSQTVSWLSRPLNAALMTACVLTGLYHGMLGTQVIIEDYIHCRLLRTSLMAALRLMALLLAIIATVAIFTCKGAQH